MHEPECIDWQEHWPQGHTTVDVSTLATSGTANPLRVSVERGPAPWLAIWSDQNGIAGLLIGKSSTDQLPMDEGGVIPYPEGADLFLTKATGGAGICHFARFRSERSARNWTRANATALRGGGSGFGPFPTASAIADSDPNPTTTRIGSDLLGWNGASWDRIKARSNDADGKTPDALGVLETTNYIVNDRASGVLDRLRQPDSFTQRNVLQLAQSVTTTGVKATATIAQDGQMLHAYVAITTQLNSAANVQIQLRRTPSGGAAQVIASTSMATATAVGQVLALTQADETGVGGATIGAISISGFSLIAGDVIDINVLQAATTAGAADCSIGYKMQRLNF